MDLPERHGRGSWTIHGLSQALQRTRSALGTPRAVRFLVELAGPPDLRLQAAAAAHDLPARALVQEHRLRREEEYQDEGGEQGAEGRSTHDRREVV